MEDDEYESIKCYCEYASKLFNDSKESLINRANVLLVANSLILGGCFLILANIEYISLTIVSFFMLSIFFSLLSTAYSIAIIRVYPSKNPDMRDLIYFKVVQIMEESDFKEKVMNLNKEKVVELFIRHLKSIANFLVRRYRYLYFSFWFFIITIAIFTMFILSILLYHGNVI
ncbi:MAG: hypothetical protein J7K95_00505 [Thermoplasmata archaeon]|nr:hypothetical protein [Thermoplasmata archaeon]